MRRIQFVPFALPEGTIKNHVTCLFDLLDVICLYMCRYCTGGQIAGFCSPGYYCPSGSYTAKGMGVTSPVDSKCSPGFYGSSSGNTEVTCSGQCNAGYYCEAGSTSPTQAECAAGRRGDKGQVSADCSGPCTGGYYCPNGNPNEVPCGGANVYCPTGSSAPQAVGAGYFSTPATGSATLRSARDQAMPGSYASNGVEYKCPEGTYCAGTGLTAITGYCPPGKVIQNVISYHIYI
jgi:hypothetical protein